MVLSLSLPRIALLLDVGEPHPECRDLDVQLADIDSHLHQLLLRLGELKA
jgi:hypothetical protein